MAYKCKYYKQQKQVSYDNGETWSNLNEFRMGTLYEPNSRDCDPTMTLYRWVVYGDTFCVDGVEMQRYMKQVSYDNGETWATVLPMETQVQATGVSCVIYRWVATSDVVCLENHDNFEVKMVSANTPVSFSEYSSYYIVDTNLGGGDVIKTYTISVKTNKYDHFYVDYALTASEYYQGFAKLSVYADGNLILEKTTNSPTTVGKGIIAYPNEEIEEHEILFIASSQGQGHYLDYLTIYKPETSIEFDNYYLYKKQVSNNGGITWEDVTPSELTPSGNSLGDYSESSCTVPYDSFDATCTKIQLSSENGAVKYLKNDGLPLINKEVSYCCVDNPNSNLHYAVTNVEIGNCVRVIEKEAFGVLNQPWSFETFVIPEGVTTIKSAAFPWGNSRAPYHYSFPSTLNYLSNGTQYASISAFRLLAMTFNGTTPPATLNINIHDDNLESIYVPCESINLYKAAVGSGYASRVKCLSEHPILYDYIDGLKYVSYNDGNTWHEYWPTTVLGDYSFIATYRNGDTYSGSCTSSSAVTSAQTRPSGYSIVDMTSVEIGECTSSIGSGAFSGCTSLSSITIPQTVVNIGRDSFRECRNLLEITIPSGVTIIGESAFYHCTSLTHIEFPSGLTQIFDSAFVGCSGLTGNLIIPSGVTSIGESAFLYCSGLTSISFNSTTPPSIGRYNTFNATNNCPIYVPSASVNAYKSATNWSSYASRIQAAPSTRWYPSGTTCIGYDKWEQSIKQETNDGGITWNNVTPIEYSATTLIEVNSEDCGFVPEVGNKFYATYSNGTSYSAACDSSSELTSASTKPSGYDYSTMITGEIGNCVSSIASRALSFCSFTSCTIGSGVTSIGDFAFQYCRGLSSITIPDSVTSIGTSAFTSCVSLTSCTIGSGVTSIGGGAFSYCSSLTSIDIPNSVTSIGNSAFTSCVSLTSCTIGSGVTSIGTYAFRYCKGLTSIDIQSGSIGESAFSGCTSLTICTIGSGVTSIGEYAFRDCSSLTSIDIPNSVTSIGQSAFSRCSGLTSCTIGSGVTSIGNYVFNGCTSLTSCTISSGVTSIGQSAFRYCSGLTSIDIPSGVTSIGQSAFDSCSGLDSITVEATTPPTLGSYAFDSTNNCPIFVPSSSVDTYKAASRWSSIASRIQAIPT